MKKVISWIYDRRKLLTAYIVTGLLIYAEQIVLEIPNPDALMNSVIAKSSYKWELQLGRFMVPLYQMLLGYSISPALYTILAIIILSFSTLIITEILPFHSKWLRYFAGVFVIASPHVQSLLTYYYCSVEYSISMLLACLAVLLLCQEKFKVRDGIAAALLYALSLGGYQSYLFMAATLSVMVLIFSVINGETLKNLWKKTIRLLVGGAGGVILYLVLNRIALYQIHKSNVDDRGFSTMGQIDWAGLPWRIYLYVFHFNKEYFFGDGLINNSYGIVPRRYLNLIFLAFAAAAVLFYLIGGRGKLRRRIAAVLLMILIPFGTVSLYLCAPKLSIHETTGSLAASAFCLVYVFVLSFADATLQVDIATIWKKPFKWGALLVSFLVLIMNIHMAQDGQAYLRYDLNQTKAAAQSVSVDIIQAMKEYGTDKVFVVGDPDAGNYSDKYSNLRESVHWLVASYGATWPNLGGEQYSFQNLCQDYIGFYYECPDVQTCTAICETSTYASMPCYPENGSVQLIDGVIVVKFSDRSD